MHHSDICNVDTIIELFNVVLKLAFFGGFILLAFNLIRYKKTNTVKTEILNLQARLSKLRLSLKGKIKKKSNLFRSSLSKSKTAVVEGDVIDTSLKQLVENSFETSQDFQNYFDHSRKVVNFIQTENKSKPDQNLTLENDFMCSDFKTELDIVRIIKEMSNLNSRINIRIENYNVANPNQPIKKVDSLVFDSLADVNRIFKNENQDESSDFDDAEKKAS